METSQADDDGGRKASVDTDESLDQISAHIAQMILSMLTASNTALSQLENTVRSWARPVEISAYRTSMLADAVVPASNEKHGRVSNSLVCIQEWRHKD